jgi:uroporphyrin-III C-methyltransferase/precorrin-2 dehydrogenase/sirohydrochlorin ferrochelatase
MQTRNSLYPVFLKLTGKTVLVVGGGRIASRRAHRLVATGANVTVVSPAISPAIRTLWEAGELRWTERPVRTDDLEAAEFVFCAAGDRTLAKDLHEQVLERGRSWINCAEDESFSDFHVAAVASRGSVQLAVSTSGSHPSVAGQIRDRLQDWLEQENGSLETALAEPRARVLQETAGENETSGETGQHKQQKVGKVYLVGAGPGEPDLLTVRATRLLRKEADVVYYDRLVSAAILETIPDRVAKVYVGKEFGCVRRADIESLMIDSARAGQTVVRLKGGDPLIFGRGGEEMMELDAAGIDYELVPGVSALSAVPAAAGIPITCRGVASEIVVRSGHAVEPSTTAPLQDRRAPKDKYTETTFVYFMPARRLPEIVAELRDEGVDPATPVAVVQQGTLPEQAVLVSELGRLEERIAKEPVKTPALLVVGQVVRFRDPATFRPLFERAISKLDSRQ